MTRKRKQFERWRRFAAAVMLAALYGMDRFSVKELCQAARHVLVALTARRGRVDRVLYFRRMKACNRCEVYYPKLGTCGSPLSDYPETGCWCNLSVKNKTKSAQCWMDEFLGDKASESSWIKKGVN